MLINVFERVPGHGEDAALCVGDWAAAVFDGLGGLGGRPAGQTRKTEARLAALRARDCLRAELASRASRIKAEFSRCSGEADVLLSAMRLRHELEVALDAAFLELGEKVAARTLPTNCAAVLRASTAEGAYAVCLWAGDARAYLLDRSGLAQLTRDDNATGADALEDLRGAAPAPQTARLGLDVTCGGGTRLGLNVVEVAGPATLLTCSDGVYSPYRSPMHFELMLWRWLGLEPDAALPLMDGFWERHAQDDCSLVAIEVAGELGSEDTSVRGSSAEPSSANKNAGSNTEKKAPPSWAEVARERAAELYAGYINDFPETPGRHADEPAREGYNRAVEALWARYKPSYERLLPSNGGAAGDGGGSGRNDASEVSRAGGATAGSKATSDGKGTQDAKGAQAPKEPRDV